MSTPPLALIVDDNRHDAAALGAQLSNVGFTVEYAYSIAAGQEAALKHFSPNRIQPGCMLVDMVMPSSHPQAIDGYYLIAACEKAIRDQLMQRIPMIAISADMSPERHLRSTEAGASYIWEKPVTNDQAAFLASLMQQPFPLPPSPSLLESMVESGALILSFLRPKPPTAPNAPWSNTDVRCMLGTINSAIRLKPAEHQHGKALINALGGSTQLRALLTTYAKDFRHHKLIHEADCLTFVLYGATKLAMQQRLAIGRTAFDSLLQRLMIAIANRLNLEERPHPNR